MVNLADFITFIQSNMQINPAALPTTSPIIPMALAMAEETVNPALKCAGAGNSIGYAGPGIYELAVYNLAGDNLINFAPDQPGQSFFSDARTTLKINSFVAGVIASSADTSTSESMTISDAAKGFTLANLQNLKTPWGRTYLQIAQSYGPNVWGMS